MSDALIGIYVSADVSKPLTAILFPNEIGVRVMLMQACVGGSFTLWPLKKRGIAVYCNDDGDLLGLKPNHRLLKLLKETGYKSVVDYPVVGDCIILGPTDDNGDNVSVPDALIKAAKMTRVVELRKVG